jgi:hypothetical protein
MHWQRGPVWPGPVGHVLNRMDRISECMRVRVGWVGLPKILVNVGWGMTSLSEVVVVGMVCGCCVVCVGVGVESYYIC